MKNTHYMTALHASTVRDLIEQVNRHHIRQSDIVSILKENEVFILLYYSSSEE